MVLRDLHARDGPFDGLVERRERQTALANRRRLDTKRRILQLLPLGAFLQTGRCNQGLVRDVGRVVVPVLKRDEMVVATSIGAGVPSGSGPDNACHAFVAMFLSLRG